VPVDDDKDLRIFSISDLDEPLDAELHLGVFTYEGRAVQQAKTPIRLDPRSSRLVASKPLEELCSGLQPNEVYLVCELKKGEATLSSNIFHFSELKRVELPQPEIRPEVLEKDGRTFVRLQASRFAKNVYLSTSGISGRFGDNFLDLIPGRSYEIEFVSGQPVSVEELERGLKIVSLRDTY
jgi:beta-mannosidase